jgi:group I intron endonuclease
MIGIYKIINPSGKIYIGESINIKERWDNYKRLECKRQRKLYYSLNKYGYDNHIFEILMECKSEDLKYFESCFQEIYVCVEKGLNLRYTGRDEKKQVWSYESRQRASESKKGKSAWNKGKKTSKESIEKTRKALIKHYENKENRDKISNTLKKAYENGYINPSKGIKKTQEQIDKNKKNMLKYFENPENRKKQSKRIKEVYKNGFISPVAKMVINTQNGFIFNSGNEAYLASGFKKSIMVFNRMLNGKSINKTNYEYIDNIK